MFEATTTEIDDFDDTLRRMAEKHVLNRHIKTLSSCLDICKHEMIDQPLA